MASSHLSGQQQEIRTYAELQKHMHNALREQHPDWIGPDGDCSAYDGYEKRFADLLASFAEKNAIRRSTAVLTLNNKTNLSILEKPRGSKSKLRVVY